MTDNTSDIRPDAAPGVSGDAASNASPSGSPPATKAARPRSGGLLTAFLIVLLLAVALGGALWAQRRQFVAAGKEVASRIDQLTRDLTQARQDARQALALAQAQAGNVADLEDRIREVQTQNSALQQAWQSFSSGASDEMLLNDVERSITLASQQLRLAGDVSNAIVALETAQSRLAQADRPRMASLQQSINGDLDRLRAVTTVDIPALSTRLDRLGVLLNRAPLLVPDKTAPQPLPQAAAQETAAQPEPAPAQELPADARWWERWRAEIASWPARAGATLVRELGDLIRVQRVDEPAALLLSPEQADMVRATLRQRLLTAQLAMLMRQQLVWKNEIEQISDTLTHYYDAQSPDTIAARNLVRELERVEIAVRVPDVSDSLSSLAALRAAGLKSGQD